MGRRAATQLAGRLARCLQTSAAGSGGRAHAVGGSTVQRGGQVFTSTPAVSLRHAHSSAVAGGAGAGQRRGLVLPAEAEPAPEIYVDSVGAVSIVTDTDLAPMPGVFRNVDGHRNEDGRYAAFTEEITGFIPRERQFTDPVRTFAYGTDASFYRLNPRMVVKVHSETEVARILPIARRLGVPVTFRAAGTSLSGQAITDSVLLKLSHTGKNFRRFEIHGDGSAITVEPGLIGGEINRLLAAHKKRHNHPIQYKIGPDPSSIDSCMVGGMVANNSSGMCCGVSQNTYHTLRDLRAVFADGSVLDTADPASCDAWVKSHPRLVAGVAELAQRVQADRQLAALVRRKFAIKCTTGYSLNALVDFPTSDPVEIIKRLLIGSEGTLGFVSQATYNTVPEWPHKASAFVMFPDIYSSCRGASILRDQTAVDAVEMFDRASLREVERDEGMVKLVKDIQGSDPMASALLIECRGRTPEALEERICEVRKALLRANLPFGGKASQPMSLDEYCFKHEPADYNVYWDVRKGLIPIVGAARETGTSMLIEDVACPVDKLADMTMDLVRMFEKYGYHDASCFGHALEGNLHLVFSQGFRTAEEVQRFSDLMDEMCYIVATKHSGSLKGEHGTGRNVAPYVEMEWGSKAYELMWELKELFDPDYVLNPGVILNKDPNVHLKNLKPSPPASAIVDRCIECGFCESNCPSRDITLTPRQRITTWREISRLQTIENRTSAEQQRLDTMRAAYSYQGDATCAADGMCQEKCPVKINTGSLIKSIRADELAASSSGSRADAMSMRVANNYGAFVSAVPKLLNVVDFAHRVVGAKPLEYISGALNRVSGHYIPEWNPYMPRGAAKLDMSPPAPAAVAGQAARKVVYMPTCVTRMMGPSRSDTERSSVHQKMLSLFAKGGYEVVYPEGLSEQCCGMIFSSKGFKGATQAKGAALEAALLKASEGGKLPIVVDTSPCLAQIKGDLTDGSLKFSLYEPVEFIRHFLMDRLEWRKVRDSVAIHVPCSSKKMGIANAFETVAGKCAHEVVPTGVPCCGMAGDRGMRYPELTAGALQHLALPQGCKDGYSTSRTCEVSLSNHSGVNFRGLVYLVDEATTAKQAQAQA